MSDLQHQLRLKARHEVNLAKGDRFAAEQDENKYSVHSVAKVSCRGCMCPEPESCLSCCADRFLFGVQEYTKITI